MGVLADISAIKALVTGADTTVETAATRTIHVTSTFLDGATRYTAGSDYDIGPDKAAYFVGNGWATDLG